MSFRNKYVEERLCSSVMRECQAITRFTVEAICCTLDLLYLKGSFARIYVSMRGKSDGDQIK